MSVVEVFVGCLVVFFVKKMMLCCLFSYYEIVMLFVLLYVLIGVNVKFELFVL